MWPARRGVASRYDRAMTDIQQQLETNQAAAEQRLRDWLAIPSISTDPAHKDDVRRAGQWCAQQLRGMGLEAELLPTAGHPCVVAHAPDAMVANPAAPRVLFYGHFDVQPPDPVDGWTSPPFEPTVRDGAIYARGASDDKGQTLCILEALRAYHEAGQKLPGPVTLLIEGEEEIGSIHLNDFLDQHRDRLAADIAVVSDTSMWDAAHGPQVAITYAMRGLVYFDAQLHGPKRDLHSGVYGGTMANPATLLARVLGRLFDDDNRIAIPGFYDDVAPVTPEEHDRWQRLGFGEQAYFDSIGAASFGEKDRSVLERRWARPSCDVNGLYGGFMGEGAKTVIPRFAGAKVSFRIPAHMDPHKVARQFTDWLHQQDVGGCRWQITNHGEAWPVAADLNSPHMAAAQRAIQAVTGQEAALVREGATIPVGAELKNRLGVDTLFIGFGLNSDNIHSPDEHLGLDRFHLGARVHARLLQEIAAG